MRLLLVALTLTLLAAAPARAEMEVGMSDDLTVVYGYHDRALALKQFKAMGGTNVRINIEHKRNGRYDEDISAKATRTNIKFYDGAIDAVIAAGLEPQLTLSWRSVVGPQRIAGWMRNVAAHYAGRVRRYSVMNEPDLLVRARGRCDAAGERRFRRRFPGQTFVYDHEWRAYEPTLPHGMDLHIACLHDARGRLYRPMVVKAANAIREAIPDAQVLAGETSAQVGLQWFVRPVRPRSLHVTGWAHHPFQLHDLTPGVAAHNWGIGNLARVKRLIGLPLYLTEFGYAHPHSSMDKRVYGRRISHGEVAKVLPRAWRIARRAGAREMLQFQWFVKPKWRHEYWETALLDKDNGKLTPAYRALRTLIRRWHR